MLGNALIAAVVPTTDLSRAKAFYEGRLGLEQADIPMPGGGAALYTGRDGTTLLVYERATAGESQATCASFHVDDFGAVFDSLRSRGVVFEDYDLGEIRTTDGVAEFGSFRSAWFKDPDGNILALTAGGA